MNDLAVTLLSSPETPDYVDPRLHIIKSLLTKLEVMNQVVQANTVTVAQSLGASNKKLCKVPRISLTGKNISFWSVDFSPSLKT